MSLGLVVMEKMILKGFYHMAVAAILVTWPEPFEQTFIILPKGVSIWNLNLII